MILDLGPLMLALIFYVTSLSDRFSLHKSSAATGPFPPSETNLMKREQNPNLDFVGGD